jgi:hypothetical protein
LVLARASRMCMLLCATIDGLYTVYLCEVVWYTVDNFDTRTAQSIQQSEVSEVWIHMPDTN